jgi:hypothetical protein
MGRLMGLGRVVRARPLRRAVWCVDWRPSRAPAAGAGRLRRTLRMGLVFPRLSGAHGVSAFCVLPRLHGGYELEIVRNAEPGTRRRRISRANLSAPRCSRDPANLTRRLSAHRRPARTPRDLTHMTARKSRRPRAAQQPHREGIRTPITRDHVEPDADCSGHRARALKMAGMMR